MDPEGLQTTFDSVFAAISQARESFEPRPRPREMGVITSIATGVAKVSGLPGVGFEELVTFPGDILGIALMSPDFDARNPDVEALIANDGPSGRSRPLSRARRC